ncbi:DUF4365 domain-containing protein [Cellulosimicrobium sp. JZ28]|uniref:DUF4365 domain-containing protein n=1 Tax=Cellulosimicrobium sp. JZ28 TaxID=1906273 RepID=UPI00188B2E8D|nr:DUF4365 domain-containing protein [Cellulosimicrobium sp. JZ28]
MSLAVEPSDRPAVLRGSPERLTNHMEQLQNGYVQAIAAAAGCGLLTHSFDSGVDFTVTHRADTHHGHVASLELQLKATSQFAGVNSEHVEVRLSRARYDYYRSTDVTIPRIVVAMSQPREQDDWVDVSHDALTVRHAAYWVSLRGAEARETEYVNVRVPRSQIFDDKSLCDMMCRIGQGGHP